MITDEIGFKHHFVRKKNTEKLLRNLSIQTNNRSVNNLQWLQIQAFTFFMVLELSRSWSVVSDAHVQAFAQKLARVLDYVMDEMRAKLCSWLDTDGCHG